jgi:ferric iron reductase protein FhuF
MTGEQIGCLPPAQLTWPGTLLTDDTWLSGRVDQIGRQFGCSERRVNATLWWYSASVVLLGPAVHALVMSGTVIDLSPDSLRFRLGLTGYLERVIPGSAVPDPDAPDPDGSDPGLREVGSAEPSPSRSARLGRLLDDVLGRIIEPLARAGSATERSLWAIAADSLATRVLAETSVSPAGAAAAPRVATAIAQAADRLRPLPRFVDVDPYPEAPGSSAVSKTKTQLYVQRGSCCLLYRVPQGLCLSCPKQTPADRTARLQQHARTMMR